MVSTLIFAGLLSQLGSVDRGEYFIAYESVGSGRPIVMIAGGPGFSGAVLRPLADGLKSNARCILFDHAGTGASQPKSPDGSTPKNMDSVIADLEALRKHLGYSKWGVFGQSWGTLVAVAYAAKHPRAVDALVLCSNPSLTVDGFDVLTANLEAKYDAETLNKLKALDDEDTFGAMIVGRMFLSIPFYFFDVALGKKLVQEFPRSQFDPYAFIGYYTNIKEEVLRPIRTEIGKWKGSCLIVQGHQDVTGAAAAYELQKLIKNSKLVMLNRCGHFPWLETPGPFFNELRQFFAPKP